MSTKRDISCEEKTGIYHIKTKADLMVKSEYGRF